MTVTVTKLCDTCGADTGLTPSPEDCIMYCWDCFKDLPDD